MKLPPLRAVHYFESVARLLSFSKAAEELNVTQSAVSHQVRLLEDI
ncbi:putative transcriptional regulator [Vibrio ishigakensis]|uniref:Putative transcriptional regulator n=1 Tax=Vibrio ishigakensis TaxID=1481914 RepID=A0A0B8PP88_9VIBR|nr:putative transcriptional regulator [Vibrio ishigakensis]